MSKLSPEREALEVDSSLCPWTLQALFAMAREPLSEGWERHDSAVLSLMIFSPEVRTGWGDPFCLSLEMSRKLKLEEDKTVWHPRAAHVLLFVWPNAFLRNEAH